MIQALLQVLLYAIVAGLSPLAFAATIAVTHTGRARALAFGIGFVAAQLAICSLLVGLGVAAGGRSRGGRPGLQIVLEGAIGAALVWLARRVRRKPLLQSGTSSHRTRRLLDRLAHLRPVTALAAGVALGTAAPKRLVLAALAATAISTAALSQTVEATFVILYCAIATALVWGPIVLFILLGDRAIDVMARGQHEVARRQPQVTVYALLILAALFAADALGTLVAQLR